VANDTKCNVAVCRNLRRSASAHHVNIDDLCDDRCGAFHQRYHKREERKILVFKVLLVVHREPHHVERSSEFWHYRNMEANRAQIPAGVKFNIAGENILSAIHLRHDKHHQQHLQEESQKALHLQLPMNNWVVDLQQRHESNTINVLL